MWNRSMLFQLMYDRTLSFSGFWDDLSIYLYFSIPGKTRSFRKTFQSDELQLMKVKAQFYLINIIMIIIKYLIMKPN